MAELLRMPEIAAATTHAVLSSWPVAEGGTFGKDDPVVVVETDKAEVDIPADFDGTLLRALVPAGAEVEVGSPIAVLTTQGEQVTDIDALLTELGVGAGKPAETRTVERRDVPEAPAPSPAPTATPAAALASAEPVPAPANGAPDHGGRIFASPLARKMAKEAGLRYETLTGTGPGGRIVRRDVEAAISARRAEADRTPAAAEATPADRPTVTAAPPAGPTSVAPTAQGPYEDIPHTRMRRTIAARLLESKQTAPHFYLRASCNADALLALREQINTAAEVKVSVNDLLVKAVARAHVLVPGMNAIWTDNAVRRFSTVDVSVAIATDKGLVTPVLRGVESMSVTAIASTVRDYAARAKSGGLQQTDLEGGSITISNLGMFGVEEFAAIINPPQSAILAVGAARDEPVVIDGALEVAKVLRVTLSVDHRPVDGALAAKWISALTTVIENPLQILL
jgi:pyruvate dehydrogenase E2 component (dihydrolipoamide acetyltransferase)